ncbi:Nuclear cap-binding protein subunit 3, partial [Taenia solium]
MFLTDSDASTLSITIDAAKINVRPPDPPPLNCTLPDHCLCKTEICQCGSDLGVTEANAKGIYAHLGFVDGRDVMVAEGYRMDTLHVWGTHDLSTKDLLDWLEEYNPKGVEWIDDSSCNILMQSENIVLRVLNKLAEPFDRRIALAAMAAVVSTMDADDNSGFVESPDGSKNVPVVGATTNLMPPNGRWFKSVSSPERAFCLYFRIAHKSDVKLPGAERRSNYYRRYGNPNYGGAVGLLSRSYRRRAKAVTPSTDTRCVTLKAPRSLITYDDDVHGLVVHLQQGSIADSDEEDCHPRRHNLPPGRRREAAASGLSRPPRNPPPKWPRRFSGTSLTSLDAATVFHPPVHQSALNFDFGRMSVKQRLGTRIGESAPALATVTIFPDDCSRQGDCGAVRMLTSLRMVADVEEEATKAKLWLQSENIFNQRQVICGSLRGGTVAVVIWMVRGPAGKVGFGIDLAETLALPNTIAPSSSVLVAST